MKEKFEKIIKYLIGSDKNNEIGAGLRLAEQFNPDEKDSTAIARNLNSAFLIASSGVTHPLCRKAVNYLNNFESHPSWEKIVRFYKEGVMLMHSEISNRCYEDARFERDFTDLYSWLTNPENLKNKESTVEKIRQLFFPEAVSLCENRVQKINALREKRTIEISILNPAPVVDPAKEILFTANILVTIPPTSKGIDDLAVSSHLKQMLKRIIQEEQIYWYDHPIPIGVDPGHNEVLYGLEGLDKAIAFEKQRGTVDKKTRATCVLSVSVTHEGLQEIVKEYLENELRDQKNIQHLEVYIFTEADTVRLIEDILIPAKARYLDGQEDSLFYKVIGVDGEYGRHYSFLKAIAAFWHVFISPAMKGTFKIDLDQVFPQKELMEQSGFSALEHLKTPLWGAEGIDSNGNTVDLGMIAGSLVNQKDIGRSLFTPDVCFPPDQVKTHELIFFSTLPQALSTEAEMMTRYTDRALDGKSRCIQRIHVTGGTCGILIQSLRKYQPFTPTFIGRAEDQAYLLSVLFSNSPNHLRYVHKDGLIMRHDKETFAGEAIKMAATGKLIGDYIRILIFSYYVKVLPWSLNDIKDAIDPFTGCFVSKIPLTIVHLRFALNVAAFFAENTREKNLEGLEFLENGARRLHDTIRYLTQEPNPLVIQFQNEKQGWSLFYAILDKAEAEMKKGDPFATGLRERANTLIRKCKINFAP